MTNIRMAAPITSGNFKLSDGVTVAVVAGFASVPDTSWHAAKDAGFAHDDATKSNSAPYRSLGVQTAPGNWPQNGTITAPDGTAITVTAGKALVPAAWVNYYMGFGFSTQL